jgi:hypothetical protein
MTEYDPIYNGEKGLSVRAKINKSFYDLTIGPEGVNELWVRLNNLQYLRVSKVYANFDAMIADRFNPIRDDGYPLKNGELVSVLEDPDPARRGFYRRIEGGWTFMYAFSATSHQQLEDIRAIGDLDIPETARDVHMTAEQAKNFLSIVENQPDAKYLRKDIEDIAQKVITFLDGIKIGNYIPGLLGSGGRIDENGAAELRSLRLWEFLEVPELRYNRTLVYTGVYWQTFGAGIIESVEIDKDENGNELQSGIITLKLEDGEFGAIDVDDLCQGIYHNFDGQNDTESEDQRNGNFHIQGFNTSYFRITEILDTATNGQFRYVLRGTSERWTQLNHPKPFMHFACYANPTNPDRQACSYSTTEYSIRLRNMTTWEYGENNIYGIEGKLDGFHLGGTNFTGSGQVIGNGYFYGHLQQIVNAPYELIIENGGDNFLAFGESMDITCKVMKGLDDVTAEVEEWQVTRESGNQAEDDAWNIAHQDFNGHITLQHTQTYSDLGAGISTLFRFVASSGSETAIMNLTI